MSATSERTCTTCGASAERVQLERCPLCFKYVCPDCAHRARSRRFCSERCGQLYVYGDHGDDEDETKEDAGEL